MNLTIALGIYECDNWTFHLNRILDEISKNLLNYNEILLIDDRYDQRIDLDSFIKNKDIKYNLIKHGKNLKNLSVQLTAINNCKSDYIWIIDMDDTILPYDFNKINILSNPDLIYFDSILIYDIKNSIFKIERCLTGYQYLLKLQNDNDKSIFQLHYDNIEKGLWFKIINVDFIKKCVSEIDLNKFKMLRYSNDVLLNLYIFKNVSKILLINDLLPYVYDNKSIFNYYHKDANGNPNKNIKKEVIESWKRIYDNTDSFEIKRRWFNNLKFVYKEYLDFDQLNI